MEQVEYGGPSTPIPLDTPEHLKLCERSDALYKDIARIRQLHAFWSAMYTEKEVVTTFDPGQSVPPTQYKTSRIHGFLFLRTQVFLSLVAALIQFLTEYPQVFADLTKHRTFFQDQFDARPCRSPAPNSTFEPIFVRAQGDVQSVEKRNDVAQLSEVLYKEATITVGELNDIVDGCQVIADRLDLLINDVSHGHLNYEDIAKDTLMPPPKSWNSNE